MNRSYEYLPKDFGDTDKILETDLASTIFGEGKKIIYGINTFLEDITDENTIRAGYRISVMKFNDYLISIERLGLNDRMDSPDCKKIRQKNIENLKDVTNEIESLLKKYEDRIEDKKGV